MSHLSFSRLLKFIAMLQLQLQLPERNQKTP
jgi:hypothetical protein